MTLTFDIESRVLNVTHLLIMINILAMLYENALITFEVTVRTSSDGQTDSHTDAHMHRHSKYANCGDYVSLTASELNKKLTTMPLY